MKIQYTRTMFDRIFSFSDTMIDAGYNENKISKLLAFIDFIVHIEKAHGVDVQFDKSKYVFDDHNIVIDAYVDNGN